MSRRSQGALFTVLWSWVAFAATAAWFGHDLAIYPTRSRAQQIAVTSPGVPDAYHVLLAAGVVGVAATAVAALAFAIGAARDAHSRGLTRVYLLMAVPPVVAAAWIGGIRLIPRNGSHEGLAVFYLLLGVAGIAASTQAVVTVIRTCEFDDLTWRIGGVAAAAVTAAMVVATGATIAWGLVIHAAMARQGDIGYWLVVTVILAVTSVRALIAMGRTRHDVSGEQAAAQPG